MLLGTSVFEYLWTPWFLRNCTT